MKKLTKKDRLGVLKVSAASYVVCSTIGWFKEGGIQFFNEAGSWTIKVHKTMGVIDVFRLDGHLKDLDVFGGDWILMLFGMGMSVIAAAGMKLIYYFQDDEPKTKKTPKGFKVKLNNMGC